ncbi:hypothetical protein ACIJYE_04670 [Candidatus Pelagibacter bacterium nBUS_30]|uniref:hypothetical protein n=1 Tax=Candidatus Pelagibacter bacterium nBUS_30 TaxID=3374191 RepID=UPI003EB6A2BA
MKKNIIKYTLLLIVLLISSILYLSLVGIDTEKFNNQIREKVTKVNNGLEIELKKIKLTLDPFNFKINAKTIGANILYKGKNLELEYIKTKISLISLIKGVFVSSSLELSTRSILLKDLVTFIKASTNVPELFILERAIKKGQVIANIKLNFDEKGEIKQDYKISGYLIDGKIGLLKKYNFEKINFFLDVKDDIFNFKELKFRANKTNFFSKNLKITKNKKDFLFEGDIQNQNSNINHELLKLLNLNFENFNFLNINLSSKNEFLFNIDNELKIKNLDITSEIKVNNSEYIKPILLNDYFPDVNDLINFKDHKIQIRYKNNDLTLKGSGEIKLENNYDEIEYKITNNKNIFNLDSKINLSELKLRSQEFLKPFFSKINKTTDLKNQQIEINYNKDNLSIKGSGKIKLENEFDELNFSILKTQDKYSFNFKSNLENTSLNIDFLNFNKKDKSKIQLNVIGSYNDKNELNFNKINIIEKNNKIKLENFILDKDNLIIKVDKVDLDYFDTEDKKNQLLLLRKQKSNYHVSGALFNANKLIDSLLNNKQDSDPKIFRGDLTLSLNFDEVNIDEKNIVKNLKGKFFFKDNEVFNADISALFEPKGNLVFTVSTNDSGEKITSFNSSRAKPIVDRYKFIKGFEEGNLDFYSSKKNNISNSVLIIDNFKVQEVPALAKLLSLASLQGIADLLTGEGIRFTDFEMSFSNNKDLMTIKELYAIGPSISLLIEGYIQSNNLISLRGTLVPATTINRTIASIPLIGDLLIGKKVGEGVFGVSFKIKGPSRDLKTTVNPIKTLTPRFITRTLEKIQIN